jgi:hypothetical protein
MAISESLHGIGFSDADVERARLLRHYPLYLPPSHRASFLKSLRCQRA